MKKRILHIISSLNWRGGEQQVDYLFNHTSAEFEYYLFCPEKAELVKRNAAKKENIFTYKKRFGVDVFAALELKKVCKKNQIDLIHLHDSHAINTYLLADLLGMNIPALIHRHVNFLVVSKWKYKHHKIKKIICVSETIKNGFSHFVDAQKLCVIHPGIDLKRLTMNDEQLRVNKLKQELSLSNETSIIGIVSALEKEKNIREFIEIAENFIKQHKNYHFIIIGDGSLKSQFQHLNSNIHLLGFRNNIQELLPSFDIFLFTSKNEGFPLVLLEAMASKVPVLSYNFPAANELLQHEKNGLSYNNVEDAVHKLQLLNTEIKLRTTLVENAFQFIQQFDITLMNQQIEEVYKSIFTHD